MAAAASGPAPRERIAAPSTASPDSLESLPAFDTAKEIPKPRSAAEMIRRILALQLGPDPDMPALGHLPEREYKGWLCYGMHPMVPLRPHIYVNSHTRSNPCPEEYW